MLKALHDIGLDRKDFGVHSLRSGGATAAANRGVPDRLSGMVDGRVRMLRTGMLKTL